MSVCELHNTYSRLQFRNLIPGLAQFLQHFVELMLHVLTVDLFILKVLRRQQNLGRDASEAQPENYWSSSVEERSGCS